MSIKKNNNYRFQERKDYEENTFTESRYTYEVREITVSEANYVFQNGRNVTYCD